LLKAKRAMMDASTTPALTVSHAKRSDLRRLPGMLPAEENMRTVPGELNPFCVKANALLTTPFGVPYFIS
jgi:hypothetical protein